MIEKIPLLLAAMVLFSVIAALSLSSLNLIQESPLAGQDQILRFSSQEELEDFVKTNTAGSSWYGGFGTFSTNIRAPTAMPLGGMEETAQDAGSGAKSEDYSTTNIQVAGVDEPDIVKNDGKYIYTVYGNNISIIDAYPAENAELLSVINLDGVQEIFVNGDRLIVFGQEYNYYSGPEPMPLMDGVAEKMIWSGRSYSNAFVKIYDITDRSAPSLARNMTIDGNYFDSRMIGDYVYVIVNQYATFYNDVMPMPRIVSNGVEKEIPATDIYYFPVPDYSYQFTTILSLNAGNDAEEPGNQVILTGTTNNIFVSMDNIYLTFMKRVSNIYMTERMINEVVVPSLPIDVAGEIMQIQNSGLDEYEKMEQIGLVFQEYMNKLTPEQRTQLYQNMEQRMQAVQAQLAKEMEKTVVHRISIQDGNIQHTATGEVPGYTLNQFSMDEYNDYFRIATTTGQWGWGQTSSQNHVYVLDSGMNIVGKLEDLAPGERIYSTRFMGDRVYMVTFRQIDPFYVIDLSDPANPRVLGFLKIPGYSDYLHPYDENHIIGIGKETVESKEGDFSWQQGVKISLFEVTDVEKPKEIAKFEIGDRGTESYALHDHKAFLFSREKNLLVIPILLAEIDEEKYPQGVEPRTYGDYVWQGAYVLNIDLENGISLRDRVTHIEDDEVFRKSGYYYFEDASSVKRSLYMDDVLYTISGKLVKANDLSTLEEISRVDLPYSEERYYWIMEETVGTDDE